MTATPYGGEDQPTRLQALAQEAPHMDNREVARLTKKYTATNLDLYAPPTYVTPGDCYCGDNFTDHTAWDGRCFLCDCPQYAEKADVEQTAAALADEDACDGERRRNNTADALTIIRQRRRTA